MPNHRKSAAVKAHEGNRAKLGQKNIPVEPKGIGHPVMPVGLSEDESEIWWETIKSLPDGLLTGADVSVLERFCRAYSRYRRLTTQIDLLGDMVKSPSGWKRNPLYTVLDKAEVEMHRTSQLLGLSPVSRARLAAPETKLESPMSLLLDNDPEGSWSGATSPRNGHA